MVGIVVVDGTGTGTFVAPNDDQYRVDYQNSACSRISRMFPAALYQRGPWLDGANMGPVIEEAYRRAMGFAGMFGRGCGGLCLIGHSRGGAAVIAVAQRLKQQNIKYYQDVLLWPVIHDANRQRIGSNPNLIMPAWRLAIPSIAGYTPGQLDAIRQRGRNC